MHKKIISLLLLGMLSLSGCSKTQASEDVNEKLVSIEQAREQYLEDINSITAKKDGKLIFEDCEFVAFPSFTEVVGLSHSHRGITAQEGWTTIEDWLIQIELDDVIDMGVEVRDASGVFNRDDSNESPYCYVCVWDNFSEFESGHGFLINTTDCYIQLGEDGIYSMSDGTMNRYLKTPGKAFRDALGFTSENIVKSGMEQDLHDEQYELIDEELTIGAGAELVEKYFESGTPFEINEKVTVEAVEVNVFCLGNKYGYEYQVRRVYGGIPFSYLKNSVRTYASDEYQCDEDWKKAYVADSTGVCAFTGYSEAEILSPLGDSSNKMLGLKDAVDILNTKLANYLEVNVDRTELVYCTIKDKAGERKSYVTWLFTGINENNGQGIRIYIDVLSGEIYYYTFGE